MHRGIIVVISVYFAQSSKIRETIRVKNKTGFKMLKTDI